jgi:hypothetical protein
MNKLSKTFSGVIAGCLLSATVHALPISGGEIFDVNWVVDLDDGVTGSDLSASSTWMVSSYAPDAVVLDINISNNTVLDPGVLDEAKILAFGFGVSPNASASLSSVGSVFDMVGTGNGPNQTFPGGFKHIDVCVYAQGCNGGNVNEGLAAGDTDMLRISLFPETGQFGDSLELLFFPAKFQTTLGSFEPAGTPETSVPEPATLGLMALGMLTLAFSRRAIGTPG